MNPATVTCGNCRHEFAATGLFCPHCGRPKVRELDGDVLLGKVLGERFVVQERIGQGASGTIYRAEHVTLRRKVAVKVLHHELSRDDLALERFRREATTVGDIDNEHIVEIHDFGRTPDGRLYLAMELLEGETLDIVLTRGRLAVDQVVDVMSQVGEALIEAHAIGYVHRDIRPRNVLLQYRRNRANFVKILDFGLAKLVENEGTAASTSLGMTFGDPRYMSPEQARGDAIDRRADLYQLGCVGYEMLTGQAPFVGGRVFDVLSRHVSEAPVMVSKLRADVPPWLEAAVMRMLAKKPDERFATMSRMVEALRVGQQTGAIMDAQIARVEEAEPPPSVSRIMEKLKRTSLGPHGDEVVAAAAAAPVPAPTPEPAPVTTSGGTQVGVPYSPSSAADSAQTTRVGPRGTPKVGVPVTPVVEPGPPAASAMAETSVETPAKGGVWARPRNASEPPPSASSSSPPRPRTPSGAPAATGKPSTTGQLRAKRPSDTAGISSVWFADGDQLDGGGELDEAQARKLDRARSMRSGDSMSDSYLGRRPRPIGKLVAIGAGAVALLIVLVLVVTGGSSNDSKAAKPGSGTAAAVVVDAAPAQPVAVDAGVPIDAGAGSASGSGGKKASGSGTTKKNPDPIPDPDPDPDPLPDPDPDPGSGSGDDPEAKLQADFHAKAGDQQLGKGDSAGAVGSYKKALALDARNATALTGLGRVAMGQGLYADAIKHLKKAVKIKPGSARIHTLLGECYLNNGDNKQAAAAFMKALKIDPDNADARSGYTEAEGRLPPTTDD